MSHNTTHHLTTPTRDEQENEQKVGRNNQRFGCTPIRTAFLFVFLHRNSLPQSRPNMLTEGCLTSLGNCLTLTEGCLRSPRACLMLTEGCLALTEGCLMSLRGCLILTEGCSVLTEGCSDGSSGWSSEFDAESMRFMAFST